jgi:hypothetical protein
VNQPPLLPKTPLPCIHIWEFHRDTEGYDDYFECANCHYKAPYDPADLADIEMEMGYE